MAERQWASKALVVRLVKQGKYELAAYVVLGEKTVFEMYSNLLTETVTRTSHSSESVRRRELEYVVEQAKEEIRDHRKWQDDILSLLPMKDESLGLTGPLRLAFADAADQRKKLLQQAMLAHGNICESESEPTFARDIRPVVMSERF